VDDFERFQEGSSSGAGSAASTSFDLLGIINRRKWWILTGLAIGTFVGFLIYQNSEPAFVSVARLTVSRRGGTDQTNRSNPVDYQPVRGTDLELEAVKITSPEIIKQAVFSKHLEDLATFSEFNKDLSKVIQKLYKSIGVTKGDTKYENADVLNLTFRGPDPKDTQTILDAIIEAYRASLAGTYSNTSAEVKRLYVEMRERAEREVETIVNQYRQLQAEAPFLVGDSNLQLTMMPYQTAMQKLQIANEKAESLKALRDMAQSKLASGEPRTSVLYYLMTESDNISWPTLESEGKIEERQMVNTSLIEAQARLEELKGRGLGDKHPEVTATKAKIKLYEDRNATDAALAESADGETKADRAAVGIILEDPSILDSLSYSNLYNDGVSGGSFFVSYFVNPKVIQDAQTEMGFQPSQQRPDILTERMSALSMALQTAIQRRDEALAQSRIEGERAKAATTISTQLQFLSQEMQNKRRQLEVSVEKLAQIDVLPQTGTQVEELNKPGPGLQVAPSLPLNLVLGGLVGTLLGFGLGYLIDRSDRSFRSADEIRKSLGLPVVGHIPVFFPRLADDADADQPIDTANVDKMICSYADPDSLAAEAYRAVRTNLFFSTHGESHKVIQVTSPSSNDGKSTLAANLAVSLAQSGVKVLLVDADLRRPKVHLNFGIDKTTGLSNLIRGTIELPEAIHRSAIENLDIMPAGPRPRNPSELLALPRFKELLATLRDRYDFVIIDTPPILAVTDPGAVAVRADGVLIALQIRRKVRPSAERAVEILTELGANILGVVVNGVGWRRAFAYREGGDFGSGSRFYKYNEDFRGSYLLGDTYAYSTAGIEQHERATELVDAEENEELPSK
jgi:capsular exopolysaccharide synthesis family protein